MTPSPKSRVLKRKEVLDGFASLPPNSLVVVGRPDLTPQPKLRPAAPSQSYTVDQLAAVIENAKKHGHTIAVIGGRQAPKIGQWLTEQIQDGVISLGPEFGLELVCQLKGKKIADIRIDENGIEWLCTKKGVEPKLAPELEPGQWRNVKEGQKVVGRQGELQLDKDDNVILLPKGKRVGWTVDAFDAAAIYHALKLGRLSVEDLKEPNYRDPDWRDRIAGVDTAVLKATNPQAYVDLVREAERKSMIDQANDARTVNAAGGHAAVIDLQLQALGQHALTIAGRIVQDPGHRYHLHAKYFLNAGKFLDKPSKEGIVTAKKGGVKFWGDWTAAFHAAIKYDRTTKSFSLRPCAFINRQGDLIDLPFVTNSYAHSELLGGNADRVSTTPSGASRLVDCWNRTLQTFGNREQGNELALQAGSMNRFERNIYQFLNWIIQEAFTNADAWYNEEDQGELF